MKRIITACVLSSLLPVSGLAVERVSNEAADPVASAAVHANRRALAQEAPAAGTQTGFPLLSIQAAATSLVGALVGSGIKSKSEVETIEQVLPGKARRTERSRSTIKPVKSFAEEMASLPEVRKYLKYYTSGRGRGIAIRGYVRSREMEDRAREIFREEGVPIELVWLAQVESGWRSVAVSPVGAAGVWQFMPATAERFGMSPAERANFEKATRGAAKYLRWLNKRYDGNWPLAIGAYNCGEGNMDKAVRRNGGRLDFFEIARKGYLPTETENYVPAVLAASVFGTDPDRFELTGRDAVTNSIAGSRSAN